MTLAETSSVSSENKNIELIIVDHSDKQRNLLRQRAVSYNQLPTPPQGQASV